MKDIKDLIRFSKTICTRQFIYDILLRIYMHGSTVPMNGARVLLTLSLE